MCGIAGLVTRTSGAERGMLESLVDGVAHRGPDSRGTYVSPGRACTLGHTRLAILDLSTAGSQPMLDEEAGNAIVFNGEIYNFAALRKACEADGYRFRSHSDTEVILALYRRHGVDCLRHLRGMFAFAIWDEARQHLFFARDRLGKKPFHYADAPEGFAFCSEIDPLARHAWTDRRLDTQALAFFLQLQYIPAPLSIYRGIRKLPPAHFGLLDEGGLHIEPYWSLDYRNKLTLSEAEALEAFEEKLNEAVKLRMVADVPIGALLSGGVDSSAVVALMAKSSAAPVRTFSVGFDDVQYDESAYAGQAAQICGTLHRPIRLAAPDLDQLPALVRRYGEPFGDSSALPSFAVCAAARRELKVVLNGDGGDELLGGYPRYALSDLAIWLGGWMHRRTSALGDVLANRLGRRVSFPWQKAHRLLLQHLLLPDGGALAMYGNGWCDSERYRLLDLHATQDPLHAWRAALLDSARRASDNPIDSMLWVDNHAYLPGALLVKMDIATMHCGLEARSPLLDHELIEFCARLPIGLKVKHGSGKYLLKKLAERYYPSGFVHRRKMGFGIPLAGWLRGPLRRELDDVLRDPQCMAPLDGAAVRECLARFEHRDDDEATRIWYLFMYGLWRRYGAPALLPG